MNVSSASSETNSRPFEVTFITNGLTSHICYKCRKEKVLWQNISGSQLPKREWVLDCREVKSEEKMSFTLFEKCKWKKNDLRSRSRNESEMKMTENRDREVKVKWKSFEIEIEKWNFSRIFENLKRTDFDLSERVHMEVISFRYVIC